MKTIAARIYAQVMVAGLVATDIALYNSLQVPFRSGVKVRAGPHYTMAPDIHQPTTAGPAAALLHILQIGEYKDNASKIPTSPVSGRWCTEYTFASLMVRPWIIEMYNGIEQSCGWSDKHFGVAQWTVTNLEFN